MERWAPVKEGYEASTLGRVRSLDRTVPHPRSGQLTLRGRVLKPSVSGRTSTSPGYLAVKLGAGSRTWPIHNLVALAFLGPPEGRVVRHLNSDPHDNRLENLAYGTPPDNTQDMVEAGRQWQQSKTHCPAGHLLAEPNLIPAQLRKGWRACLACMRAHSYLRNHPELDFQTEANRYYQQITTT